MSAIVELDYLILADAVQVSDGKISMLGGGWTRIQSGTYPMILRYGIAVGLRVSPDKEPAAITLKLSILSPNGSILGEEFQALIEVRSGNYMHSVAYGVNSLITLQKPGHYKVVANIDDQTKAVTFEAALAAF